MKTKASLHVLVVEWVYIKNSFWSYILRAQYIKSIKEKYDTAVSLSVCNTEIFTHNNENKSIKPENNWKKK